VIKIQGARILIPSSPSWVWRKLLQLRHLVQPLIKYQIGDGLSTSLWYDNWHPLGPLVEKFGPRIVYDSGLADGATVSTILQSPNRWHFPVTQTLELNEVRSALPLLDSHSLPHPDSCKWTLTRNGQFTIHSLWNHTRTHYPLVNWSHIVWFPSHIPKCSLISWLAIQNRLSTEDRLVLFGIKDSSYCSFCSGVENHDHLFFGCHYTKQVWDLVSLKSQLTWQPQSLSNLVHLLSHTRGRKLKATLTKLTFTVTIYHIWIERNMRKFQNIQHTIPSLVLKICTDIRCRLLSMSKIPAGLHSKDLLALWNIPCPS